MSVHLSDDAVVDLALGEGADSGRAHAGACEDCALRVAEARSAVELAQGADVPEPSPLYWQALRSGVSRRIAEDAGRTRRLAIWLPLAAAAALTTVLVTRPAQVEQGRVAPSLAAWSALPVEDEDDGLRVLEGVALSSDELGEWDRGEGLSVCLANLTDDESKLVAETLREQGQGGVS